MNLWVILQLHFCIMCSTQLMFILCAAECWSFAYFLIRFYLQWKRFFSFCSVQRTKSITRLDMDLCMTMDFPIIIIIPVDITIADNVILFNCLHKFISSVWHNSFLPTTRPLIGRFWGMYNHILIAVLLRFILTFYGSNWTPEKNMKV